MNIMLVSVTERTREIGIRLAVGEASDILWQFLVEALTLSLSGGVVGLVLGLAGSRLLSTTAGWPLLISWGAVALASTFSGAVGVFFGFYPARKAARLDPSRRCDMSDVEGDEAMATSKMTAKGQITIPKALRKRRHLHPGDAVEIIEVEGTLRVQKQPGPFPFARVPNDLIHLRGQNPDDLQQAMRGR